MTNNDNPYIFYKAKDGNTIKTMAPVVRNAAGKHEVVVGVIYTPEGLPVGLLLCVATREVPSAEYEPLQTIG